MTEAGCSEGSWAMLRLVAAAAVALLLVGGAWGQATNGGAKKDEAGAAATAKPAMPSARQLAILVQTTVVALSQANLTGNYTVLHGLGAPGFQKANSPDRLGKLFANIRKIDLTPVILYSPLLTSQPAIDDKNMLRLTGYYKTTPQQVQFDLLFQPVAGRWRLFGISVGTRTPQPTTPSAAADKSSKDEEFARAKDKQ
jgi:hypothetical protein